MLFQNISGIKDLTIESAVLFLTNGSDIAVVKRRNHDTQAWNDSLERRIPLPYPYSGNNLKIWMSSDMHISNATYRDRFITAITDIDDNVGVDYVFVLGDIGDTGIAADYALYKEAKATSDVPSVNWYEIVGNHDSNPVDTANFATYMVELGYASLNYTKTIGNVCFIFFGAKGGVVECSEADLTWLETQVQSNSDKNIIILTHNAAYDTNWGSTNETGYTIPADDIQDILNNNRIEAWFHGHTTDKVADETFAVYKPLELYESVAMNEGQQANLIDLFDSLRIIESISPCPYWRKSIYGTFKYGERKYGKNVTICHLIPIAEDLLIKFNDTILKSLDDGLTISESLSRTTGYHLSLSDSLAISDIPSTEFKRSLSDSLSISETLANQTTLGLSDAVDFELLLEIEKVEGITFKTKWKFLVKDSSGNTIASLVNARKRWFVERLNQETEAGFILDADDSKCNATILNLGVNELHIYYEEDLMWAGQLVSARKIAKGDDIYWEVLAKDWLSLLGKRFCGVESVREFTTVDAGYIAWTLIDETQSLANGDFGITYGTVETSITRSPKYDRKNILEAIKELSNLGKDGEANYGFDFEITPLKVFNVYYPYMGTIRDDVVFRYPGNCENFEAFVDTWGIVNQEWGLGRHWTGETAIVSRADATSQATYKRREAIKSYQDMSVLAFLQDMVWQDIQWLKDPQTVVRFEARVDEKTGIMDYNVGDGVTVVCDKFDINEWLWVYERKIEIGDDDEPRVTLVVGD